MKSKLREPLKMEKTLYKYKGLLFFLFASMALLLVFLLRKQKTLSLTLFFPQTTYHFSFSLLF